MKTRKLKRRGMGYGLLGALGLIIGLRVHALHHEAAQSTPPGAVDVDTPRMYPNLFALRFY